jgi:hypothetical protein
MEQSNESPQEESVFAEEEFSMEGYDKHIRNARILLFVLALWTRKRPYTALLCAMIFYLSLIGISALMDPSTIIQGWIWKIVIIILLILGLRNGKEAQDMMDTFGKKK